MLRRLGTVAVAAVALVGAGGARAETYRDPSGAVTGLYLWQLGTDGSDASSGDVVAVSLGGCAYGAVAVGVGDPNRSCFWQGDVQGNPVGVGLLGAESRGTVAVSDTGGATGSCYDVSLGCVGESVAVSVTGPAAGSLVSVSVTGTAACSPVTTNLNCL